MKKIFPQGIVTGVSATGQFVVMGLEGAMKSGKQGGLTGFRPGLSTWPERITR